MAVSPGVIESLERMILISWLLKDFGWMTLNIYLGFTFGVFSIVSHLIMLFIDKRRCFVFYNTSLLFWVTGNFLWMTIEFATEKPSSSIHVGPNNLGGIPNEDVDKMVMIKTVFFIIGIAIQIVLYLTVLLGIVPLPEEEDEDVKTKIELSSFLFGKRQATKLDNQIESDQIDSIADLVDEFSVSSSSSKYGITLAFLENAYIIFWICKDLFWSWGTGDYPYNSVNLVGVFEVLAMVTGSSAALIYIIVSILYRRNLLRLLDAITTIFWISANFSWMCGELFIRYDSLQIKDDESQGNDGGTRIISVVFFGLGIILQLFILLQILLQHMMMRKNTKLLKNKTNSSTVQGESNMLELVNLKSMVKYHNLLVNFSPQHDGDSVSGISFDEEEESTALF